MTPLPPTLICLIPGFSPILPARVSSLLFLKLIPYGKYVTVWSERVVRMVGEAPILRGLLTQPTPFLRAIVRDTRVEF